MDRQRQGRRQSILKPPKADGHDEEDTRNFRRVRFSSNFVKEFAPGTEGDHVTVWDTTYEESISKSSLTSHSHVTLGNATLPETSNKENAASAALPLPATQPLPVCKGNNFYPEVKIKDPLLKCHETPCVIVPAFIKKQAERRANKALLSKQSQISETVHKNEHVQTMAHKLTENEAKDVILKPDPFRIPAPKAVSRKSYFNSTTFNDGSFLGNTALSPIIGDKNETPMNQNDGVKRNIIGNLNKTQIFVANHDSACMDQTEVGFGKIIEPTSIPPDKIDNATETPCKTINFNHTIHNVDMEMTLETDFIESDAVQPTKTCKAINFNKTGVNLSGCELDMTLPPENHAPFVKRQTIMFQNVDMDTTCANIVPLEELNENEPDIVGNNAIKKPKKTRKTICFNKTGVDVSGADMEITVASENNELDELDDDKQETIGKRKTIYYEDVCMEATCLDMLKVNEVNMNCEIMEETTFIDMDMEETNVVGRPVSERINSKSESTQKTMNFNRTMNNADMELTMGAEVFKVPRVKQTNTRKTVNLNQTLHVSAANMESAIAPENSLHDNEKQKTVDQKTIVFQNADIDQTCMDITTNQQSSELNKSTLSINSESTQQQTTKTRRTVNFNQTCVEISGGDMEMTLPPEKHDPFVGNAVKQEKTGNRKTILFQNVDMDTTCANITPVEGSNEKKEDFADNGTEKQKKPRKTICFNRTGLDVSGVEMEMTQTSGKIESIIGNERKPENIDNRKTIPNQNTEMGTMCLDTPIAKDDMNEMFADTKIEQKSIDDKSAKPIETRTVDFNQTGVAMSGVHITSTHCHTSLIKKTLSPENNEPLSQNVLKQKKTSDRKTIIFQNTDMDTTMQIFDQNKSKCVDLSGFEMETIKTEETIRNNTRQTVYDENFDMEETEVFVPEPLIDIQQNKEKTKRFVPYMDGDETIRKLTDCEQATKSTNLIGDTPYECKGNIDKENKPQTIQCADFDRQQTNKHEKPIFDDKNQQNKAPLFDPYIDEPYMEETKLDIDQSKTNRRTLYDDNQINLEESQLYERTTFCHVLEDSACKIVDNSEIQRNNESFQNTDKHDVLEPSIIEIMDTSRPDLSIPQDNSDLEVNESVPATPAKMGVKRDLAECTTPSVTSTKRLDDKGTPLALSKTSAKRLMQSPCSAIVPMKRIDNKQTPCKTVIEDRHLNRCEILEQEYLMLERYCNDLDEEISEHEQPLPEAIESDLEWIVEDLEEISERFDVDIIREQVEVEEEQELMIRCHFDAIDMRMREIAADNERLLAEDLPVVVVAPTLVEKITEKAKSHSEYRILSVGDDSLCMLLRLEEYEITVSFDAESGCVAAFDIDEPRRANPNPFSKYTYHFYSHALDPQHICASIGQTFSILTLMDYFECQLYEFGETLMSVFYALIEFNARIDAEQILTYKHLTPHVRATIAVNLKEHNMERVQVIATIHEGPVSMQKIQSIVDNTHRDRNFPRNIIAVLRGYLTSIEKL